MLSSASLTLTLLLAISVSASAVQFGQPGSAQPGTPRGTPPTFPSDSHPSSTMPPDTAAPPPTESSNFKIAEQIRTAIARDNHLKKDRVSVAVGDDRVTLTGEVSHDKNRYRAIGIASRYLGEREIVDKLSLRDERSRLQ